MDDSAATPTHVRHRPGRRWVLAGSLAVLATVLAVGGILSDPSRPEPSPAQSRASAPAAASAEAREKSRAPTRSKAPARSKAPDETKAPVAPTVPGAPVSIAIPSIAVSSDLIGLGLEADRTVEVPQNGDDAGWYELGTSPGQPGSAVILGHVDSVEGPAVFHRLRELVPGAQVRVTLADGAVETFEVSHLETIRNDEFPAQRVYAGTPGRPTLNIVTCGGDYDADSGGYQSNVIAYAEHVSTDPA